MSENRAPIRWGIMGTGKIAGAFTRDLLLNGLHVQAVGSRTRESADRFASSFDLPTAHASYQSLVDDDSVDVVYIATPHSEHHPNAILALNAGKHLLIEKPITVNARQARDLANLSAGRGLTMLEAMWTRFLPHMVHIREVLTAGMIGDVLTLAADHTQLLPVDPAHRINALELGGGALLDMGIYPISFAAELFGTPTSICSAATFKATGVDAQVATIFGYADGGIASTLSSTVTKGPNVATVLGNEGRIDIDAVWYSASGFTIRDNADQVIERFDSDVRGRGMQYQAYEMESLIRNGKLASDVLPPSESVTIMQTLDEVRKQIGLRYPTD